MKSLKLETWRVLPWLSLIFMLTLSTMSCVITNDECAPGTERSCECHEGIGVQSCVDSGTAWGACDCSGGDGDGDADGDGDGDGDGDSVEYPERVEYTGSSCYPTQPLPPQGEGLGASEECLFDACMIEQGDDSNTCAQNLYCHWGQCQTRCDSNADCLYKTASMAEEHCSQPGAECVVFTNEEGDDAVCIRYVDGTYRYLAPNCTVVEISNENLLPYEPGSFPLRDTDIYEVGWYFRPYLCGISSMVEPLATYACQEHFGGGSSGGGCGSYDPCCGACNADCDWCGLDLDCFSVCYGQCIGCCHRCY